MRHSFGKFERDIAKGLELRHDHGSQFISDMFQREIAFLGVQSSPSFVREPQGNGCAERFVRILKENLLWIKTFNDTEELRKALLDFKDQYNKNWILHRHGYKTPAQVREQSLKAMELAA